MDYLAYISKTDLARKTRQVIRSVQRGQTIIVESHGQPEVAILDISDYYILRAAILFQAHPPKVDLDAGLLDESVAGIPIQERYDLVMAYYLAGAISLGRAAELLDLPWVDLRTRLSRLNLPVRVGPENVDDLRAEMEALHTWEEHHKPR
jgi:prevent-host-death family protein